MKIVIDIPNPFKGLKNWFLYDKTFWMLHKVERSRLGSDDISRNYFHSYYIRHRITNKSLSYDGWGDELTQEGIYHCNAKYDKM